MKNWILKHKILSVVLSFVILAGIVCAVVLPITLKKGDTHECKASAEWTIEEASHYHACTHKGCNKKFDEALHSYDKEVVAENHLKTAATYDSAAVYYKSCVCGKNGTETFLNGASLPAKENSIELTEGKTLGKTYDKTAYEVTPAMFKTNGDGVMTFQYKKTDEEDSAYTTFAPLKAGEYKVKVTVAATSEWQSAEKSFDFTIGQIRLASVEKAFTVMYDGHSTEFDVTSLLTEKIKSDDIKLVVNMNGFEVGKTVKEVVLSGIDKDNYVVDVSKVDVTIGKARINIGQISYTMQYKGGEWKTFFTLAAGDGVVEKDGVLEDVSFEVLQDNKADWANKKSYALYTEDATKANDIERVRLIGTDAGNYTFVCDEDGNIGATLYCKVKETAIDAILDPLNDYDWGGLIVDNVTFANKKLVVGGYQGEITDKLIDDENNFKQLKFEMFVRGTEIKIAQGTRILWESDGCEHVYNDCELIPGIGGPGNLEINLLKNIDGYTDENGYWICEQSKIELTLKVTETTDVAEANQDLFADGLVKAGYALVKYTHNAEDAGGMNVELTDGATGTIETHVYEFVRGKYTELTLNGGSYDVTEGHTYYIVVYVKTPGTGNAQIVLMG